MMDTAFAGNGRETSESADPTFVLDQSDPGDETQRNFRYQHAWGVILLVAAFSNKKPYTAIWCEHHEDFLAERRDGRFDGYQVKTRRPELGDWDLTDEGLKNALRRFVEVDARFPGRIGSLYMVSNTDYLNVRKDARDRARLARSPVAFLDETKCCRASGQIAEPFGSSFSTLQAYCNCSADQLLATLSKTELVRGPGRDSYDAEVAHEHLGALPECSTLTASALDSLRDELIQRVYLASSLRVSDPSKHWCVVNGSHATDPRLAAKRIAVIDVERLITEPSSVPFRYIDSGATLDLGRGQGNMTTMRRKLARGGLALQAMTMERRALSAEQRLIERAHMNPEKIDAILNQIVSVVQGECDEAYNHASLLGSLFGRQMFDDVSGRLKKLATDQSEQVEGEPYESLAGITGLLTGECKVWWSEPFDLEAE